MSVDMNDYGIEPPKYLGIFVKPKVQTTRPKNARWR
jgi:hypothetical protein